MVSLSADPSLAGRVFEVEEVRVLIQKMVIAALARIPLIEVGEARVMSHVVAMTTADVAMAARTEAVVTA
jgi:hypothetical protein